jgi:hypothetical protein
MALHLPLVHGARGKGTLVHWAAVPARTAVSRVGIITLTWPDE